MMSMLLCKVWYYHDLHKMLWNPVWPIIGYWSYNLCQGMSDRWLEWFWSAIQIGRPIRVVNTPEIGVDDVAVRGSPASCWHKQQLELDIRQLTEPYIETSQWSYLRQLCSLSLSSETTAEDEAITLYRRTPARLSSDMTSSEVMYSPENPTYHESSGNVSSKHDGLLTRGRKKKVHNSW